MEPSLSHSNVRKGNGFVSFAIGRLLLAIYVGGVALILAVWIIEQTTGSRNAGTLAAIIGMALSPVFVIAPIVNFFGLILGIIAVLHPKAIHEGRFAAAGIATNMLPLALLSLLIVGQYVSQP